MISTIVLIGRISKEVNLKYLDSGKAICEFDLAVDRKGNHKNKITDFYPIQVWGNYGESLSSILEKGQLIAVIGTCKIDRWKGVDNNNHSKFKVVAEFVKKIENNSPLNSREQANFEPSLTEVTYEQNIF